MGWTPVCGRGLRLRRQRGDALGALGHCGMGLFCMSATRVVDDREKFRRSVDQLVN